MNKHNLFTKKIKQIVLSTNNALESYFNKIKHFKKIEFIKNNRVFFGLSTVVILTLSYFLIPTMYNKDTIKNEIKNQILKRYDVEITFNESIRYALLPKPHFVSKNLSIIRDEREIGIVKNFKAFIKTDKFFSFNEVNVKDLVFNKTDFNIKKNDFGFIMELLQTEPNENQIIFKKSNIFFRGLDNELLFLNKVIDSNFYYDSYNLENVLSSKNEIFNVPYKLTVKNDKFNKEIFIKFNSQKIRLDIENNTSYEDLVKSGFLEILSINKDLLLDYEIKKNSLMFISRDKKTINGFVDFKPFYLKINLDYDGVSSKNIFKNDSILIDLIKSEILNNENLNINISLNINDITNIAELNNLILNIGLEQGNIILSDSKIMWKNDLQILLNDAFINYNDGEISLIGKFIIDIKNIDNFYKSFQVKKIHRKKIDKIQLDFVYNFNNNKFTFDNIKLDNSSNEMIDKFIEKHNSNKQVFSNKVIFKNFVNNFFMNYSG